MSALNLTNVKTGIFNDIFMVENTGRTSIYDIFGSKTDVSNLAGISTTTLTQISSTITAISTLNSALATKATTTSVSYLNATLNTSLNNISSLNFLVNNHTDVIGEITTTLGGISADYASQPYVQNQLLDYTTITTGSNLTTGIANINNTIPTFLTWTTWNSTLWLSIVNSFAAKLTTYSTLDNHTTSLATLTTGVANINATIPSLVSNSTLTSNLSSYIPLTTYNNTISSMLVSNANNISTLTNNTTNISYDATTTTTYLNSSNIYSTTSNAIKRLTLESTNAGGTPYLTFKARNNYQSSIYQGGFGMYIAAETSNQPINFMVNNGTTNLTALKIYANGVINVGNNAINNKELVFYDGGTSDDPSTATNYSGIGTQSGGAMRYQVTTATNTHRFFCGTTQSFFITNGSGASGSDARWKSDIQNITDALNKTKQLQGKTFIYNNCVGRQMGLIGQEVLPVVPEVVIENDGYYLVAYDRLVALLIESVKELESRVSALENI